MIMTDTERTQDIIQSPVNESSSKDNNDQVSSDEDDLKLSFVRKRTKASYIKDSDSESEEIKEQHEIETLKLETTCNDKFSDDNSDEEISKVKKSTYFSDEETSPTNSKKCSKIYDNGMTSSSDNEEDGGDSNEDENEHAISESLRRRLAQGASKKSKSGNRQRKLKSDVNKKSKETNLQSETQRLIRESDINIPYHKPSTTKLQEFLQRSQQKRSSLLKKDLDANFNSTQGNSPTLKKFADDNCHNNCDKLNKEERIFTVKENIDIHRKLFECDEDGDVSLPYMDPVLPDIDGDESLNRAKTPVSSTLTQNTTKLTPKLSSINLSCKPSLSIGSGSIIDLDEEEENTGLVDLQTRAAKHVQPSQTNKKDVYHLNTIEKKEVNGRIELTAEKVPLRLNVSDEDKTNSRIQYAKIQEKLKEEMKKKRSALRKQKHQVYALDNEDVTQDDVEEDELELTDQSDTDIEEFEEDEEIDEDELEDEESSVKNQLIDDEVEEDNDLMLVETDDESSQSPKVKKKNVREPLGLFDDAVSTPSTVGSNDDVVTKCKVSERPFSQLSSKEIADGLDSSFDATLIPAAQTISHSTPKLGSRSRSKLSVCGDSQDTLITDLPTQRRTDSTPKLRHDDSRSEHSFLLDEDGLLKDKPRKKGVTVSDLPIDKFDKNDGEELLGLCSGTFGNSLIQQKETDEVLEICSGMFPVNSDVKKDDEKEDEKEEMEKVNCDSDESDIETRAFILDSDDEDDRKRFPGKQLQADDDDEEQDGDNDEFSDNEEELVNQYHGLISSKREKVEQFFEKEAELSGSDFGSDEEEDPEEDDELIEEEGDKDLQDVDEEELRNQVGRAHLKNMLDEDDRNIKLYQELLLPDGDLHSDSKRKRKFRWKGLEDWAGKEDDVGDEEGDENDATNNDLINPPEDLKMLKERLEREKIIEDLKEKEGEEEQESQFLKLGMEAVKRDKKSKILPSPSLSTFGSLLSRRRQDLAKIGENSKAPSEKNSARKSNRFIFTATSPSSTKTKRGDLPTPPAKKAKNHMTTTNPSLHKSPSIFDHL
ncbi:DgyrCDS11515 [Dimorphilus gyrociliatus]|uniref:DgyrCDS11515 n=1 Tax=Dimorphilus gyrociliatus TaxID=2664684 RepID=A0A7I8W644_9ANNE|nr:DgyrCDS11515 [Dimorphilus gyrociliatus]